MTHSSSYQRNNTCLKLWLPFLLATGPAMAMEESTFLEFSDKDVVSPHNNDPSSLKRKIATLKEEVENLTTQLAEKQEDNNRLNEQLEAYQDEVKATALGPLTRIPRLQQDVHSSPVSPRGGRDRQSHTRRKTARGIQMHYEWENNNVQRIAELETEKGALERTINELTVKLKDQASNSETTIQALNRQLEENATENATLISKQRDFITNIKEKEADLLTMQQNIEKLQAENTEFKNNNEALHTAIEKKEGVINEQMQEVYRRQQVLIALEEEVEGLQATNDTLQEELRKLVEAKEALERQFYDEQEVATHWEFIAQEHNTLTQRDRKNTLALLSLETDKPPTLDEIRQHSEWEGKNSVGFSIHSIDSMSSSTRLTRSTSTIEVETATAEQLREVLAEKKEEIANLKEQLAKKELGNKNIPSDQEQVLQKEIEVLTAEIARIEQEITTITDQLTLQRTSSLRSYGTSSDSLDRQDSTVSTLEEERVDVIATLKKEIEQIETDINLLLAENGEQKTVIEHLRHNLALANKKIEGLEQLMLAEQRENDHTAAERDDFLRKYKETSESLATTIQHVQLSMAANVVLAVVATVAVYSAWAPKGKGTPEREELPQESQEEEEAQ